MRDVKLKAYAKINLGLNVISQRNDGYHQIETVFQQIDWWDQITVVERRNTAIVISSNHPTLPVDEQNICFRAVKLIQQATGIGAGVTIHIDKRIPIGAGLGGGSSDAAAVITSLSQLWQLNLTGEQMFAIARQLGSDVPFFLYGGTALASGIGEELSPIRLPFDFYSVLVYPNIEISSTWVYKNYNFSLTKTKKSIKLAHLFLKRLPIADWKAELRNDLEEVVFQRFPILSEIKQELYRLGAFYASMSGSGSTIYGLFHNNTDAVAVMRSIPKPYQIILAKPMITKNHL